MRLVVIRRRERGDLSERVGLPQSYGLVLRRGRDQRTVRREIGGLNEIFMACQRCDRRDAQLGISHHRVDHRGAVIGARDHARAVT